MKSKETTAPSPHARRKEILLFSIVVVGIIALFAGSVWLFAGTHSSPSTAAPSDIQITQLTIDSLPLNAVRHQMEEDVNTPGLYLYDAPKNGKYALLTFGTVKGYLLNVQPEVSSGAVYFHVGHTEISEETPVLRYELYQVGCSSVGGDEAYLKLPGYGVGSEGYNEAWIQPLEDGTAYVIPLNDTRIYDRVYEVMTGVDVTENGFYRFRYSVFSTGPAIVEAEMLSDGYDLRCSVQEVSKETATCSLVTPEDGIVLEAGVKNAFVVALADAANIDGYKLLHVSCINGQPVVTGYGELK